MLKDSISGSSSQVGIFQRIFDEEDQEVIQVL